jgi:hypothetical protein
MDSVVGSVGGHFQLVNRSIAGLLTHAPNGSQSMASSASPTTYHRLDELILAVADQRQLMRDMLGNLTKESTVEAELAQREGADLRVERFVHKLGALHVLHVLVEDLDNAEDLQRMDGFSPIVELLRHPGPPLGGRSGVGASWQVWQVQEIECRVAESASFVLGNAAKNQRALQLHMLEIGALGVLAATVVRYDAPGPNEVGATDAYTSAREVCAAAATKAMYALSAIVRNNPDAKHVCAEAGCFGALLSAMRTSAPRLARKALVLLTDLIHETLAAAAAEKAGRPTYDSFEHALRPAHPFWRGASQEEAHLLGEGIISLTRPAVDSDTREKAILALQHMHAAGSLAPADAALAALHEVRSSVCPMDQCAHSDSMVGCSELRRLAEKAIHQWSQHGKPVGKVHTDGAFFHWEI